MEVCGCNNLLFGVVVVGWSHCGGGMWGGGEWMICINISFCWVFSFFLFSGQKSEFKTIETGLNCRQNNSLIMKQALEKNRGPLIFSPYSK